MDTEKPHVLDSQHLLERIERLENTAKKQTNRTETSQPSSRIRFRWLFAAVAALSALGITLFYGIFGAKDYRKQRNLYEGISGGLLVILFILIICVGALTYRHLKASENREDVRRKWQALMPTFKDATNLLMAVVCFILVVGYIWASAVPKYNTPMWRSDLDLDANFPIPSVAVYVNQTMFPLGIEDFQTIFVQDADVIRYPNSSQAVRPLQGFDNSTNYITAVANGSGLARQVTHLSITYIGVGFRTNYNSSISPVPISGLVAFDSRTSLEDGILCLLAQPVSLQPFSINYYTMRTLRIRDAQRSLAFPSPLEDPSDIDVCRRAASEFDPAYVFYDMQLEATSPLPNATLASCDVVTNSSASCPTVIQIHLRSQIVTTLESRPGITFLEIWLNVGAIVGAVQFVVWLLLTGLGG